MNPSGDLHESVRALEPAAIQGSSNRLTVSFEGASRRDELLSQWLELEQSLPDAPLTSSVDWTRTWLEVYGELMADYFFAAGRVNGQLQAITLVCQEAGAKYGPFPVRTVHLGTAGEPIADSACVEYNSIACRRDLRVEFLREVIRQLLEDLRWEEVRLGGFLCADIEGVIAEADITERHVSRFVDLSDVRQRSDRVIDVFGRSTRAALRRKLRAYGNPQVEWADNLTRAREIFEELVGLHQDRWQADGEAGAYSSPYFLQFNRTLIDRLLPQGKTALVRVFDGGRTLGCLHLLVDGDRILQYQSGAAAYHEGESPGLIANYLCIESCLQRGYRAFDHLIGEHQGKQNLSTSANSLIWARVRRPTLKFTIIEALRKGRQRLRMAGRSS